MTKKKYAKLKLIWRWLRRHTSLITGSLLWGHTSLLQWKGLSKTHASFITVRLCLEYVLCSYSGNVCLLAHILHSYKYLFAKGTYSTLTVGGFAKGTYSTLTLGGFAEGTYSTLTVGGFAKGTFSTLTVGGFAKGTYSILTVGGFV